MEREIKFRFFDKRKKIMHYKNNNDLFYFQSIEEIKEACEFKSINTILEDVKEDYILMQYINYKDIKDKEIYEDDIIQYKTQFDTKTKRYLIVKMPDIYIDLHEDEYSNCNINENTIMVIGNKHEDMELFKRILNGSQCSSAVPGIS